jgi:hypothetical protein
MPDDPNKPKMLSELGYTTEFRLPGTGSATDLDEGQDDPGAPMAKRHYGKFRGTVVENEDPYFQGRLLVNVPGIVMANWAMPCVPVTDIAMGTWVRPRIGANVWVEFEAGDPDKPIWVGCWWGPGETPPLSKLAAGVPPTNTVITIETATSGILVCDVPVPAPIPGSVVIQSGVGASSISLTPTGVVIKAPSVTISTGHFTVMAPNFSVA